MPAAAKKTVALAAEASGPLSEATTPLEIGGYAIALLGFAAFNYAKIAGL